MQGNSYAADVRSRAAVVLEETTGRLLYAKNPNLRLQPASTTKLMTAIIVMENAKLANVTTISRNASLTSPTRSGFREGDKVTAETLLYAALMRSANDAAVALAEMVAGSEERFVELMNRKAVSLGLRDTRFINSNGLPGPNQYITAYDLSMIMRHALRYPKLKEIIGTRMTEVSKENGGDVFLRNTNRLLWSDEELVGGKTGYTREARHCFVCAAERGDNMVVVALLGAPSRWSLWKETESMIDRGFKIMANSEEPVLYFAKADYDTAVVSHAVYKNSHGFGTAKNKSGVKKAKFRKKDSKNMLSAKLAKKAKSKKIVQMLSKKKCKTRLCAKVRNKGARTYKIAGNCRYGTKG